MHMVAVRPRSRLSLSIQNELISISAQVLQQVLRQNYRVLIATQRSFFFTCFAIISTTRLLVMSCHMNGEVELYESYFGGRRKGRRGRGAGGKIPVLGLLKRYGYAQPCLSRMQPQQRFCPL